VCRNSPDSTTQSWARVARSLLANELTAHHGVMRPQDVETGGVVNVPPNVPHHARAPLLRASLCMRLLAASSCFSAAMDSASFGRI